MPACTHSDTHTHTCKAFTHEHTVCTRIRCFYLVIYNWFHKFLAPLVMLCVRCHLVPLFHRGSGLSKKSTLFSNCHTVLYSFTRRCAFEWNAFSFCVLAMTKSIIKKHSWKWLFLRKDLQDLIRSLAYNMCLLWFMNLRRQNASWSC